MKMMHKLKIALVILTMLGQKVSALEYTVVKGDTLWSLSEKYLKDPFRWPEIKKASGETVLYPRKMPIGLKLYIPYDIANNRARTELKLSPSEQAQNQQSLTTWPFSYFLTTDAEKVVIQKGGQFVVVSVSSLEQAKALKKLGNNIQIDENLLRKLFKREM
ncbi:LysM peptidoglycan-binding domain-containing protein [Pseudoalteromonas luteoviolacea]|uniref:LysM peptidoglycan-binding domain-containing protein n=1 Tax=Pseudoalteromonas luteoviolacea TaxID=43657 RepID=UPI001B395DE2|nr:LysM peptidoglycan-binding domain-containing protein [Pseudoalteromonas luteoviolacea]MBQ4839833.1 LysM peptidoglycan-binding domain-containing protein [Pseudoalteromonas luteoviolacea]